MLVGDCTSLFTNEDCRDQVKDIGRIDVTLLKLGVCIFNFQLRMIGIKCQTNLHGYYFHVRCFSRRLENRTQTWKSKIYLQNQKLHFCAAQRLCKIVSFVGKPLYTTDQQIVYQSRLSYARICDKIQANFLFPPKIPYINEFVMADLFHKCGV